MKELQQIKHSKRLQYRYFRIEKTQLASGVIKKSEIRKERLCIRDLTNPWCGWMARTCSG
jgi:hypothetical protein